MLVKFMVILHFDNDFITLKSYGCILSIIQKFTTLLLFGISRFFILKQSCDDFIGISSSENPNEYVNYWEDLMGI